MHAHRSSKRSSIAIVGGETLLGKEVNDLLEARKIPVNIQLVSSFEPEGPTKAASVLALGSEEPLVMASIESAGLEAA